MPITKNKQINLIPQDEFETSSFGRILKWALSSFRIMVIVTELVVMSAFLSRFWLDSKNSDLNEELEIGKAQIEAYTEIETEFRLRQKQIAIVKNLYQTTERNKVISNISKYLSSNVFLNSIAIKDGNLVIKAFSQNEESAAQLIANLGDYKDIEDVILTQMSSNPNDPNLVQFTISAKLKGELVSTTNK